MDYRLFHQDLIDDPALLEKFRKALDQCAFELDKLPERYRKGALWNVRLFRYTPEGFSLRVDIEWTGDRVLIEKQGEDLIILTEEVLTDFNTLLLEKVKSSPPDRTLSYPN